MIHKDTLYTALSRAAWGYLFLPVDIKLGTVSILPAFVGYLLFLYPIQKLSKERRDLTLLWPFCLLLAAWNALDWVLSWGGGSVGGYSLFLNLLVSVISLYFHFQFLTDLAAIADHYQDEGEDLDWRLCRRRNLYVVLVTATDLITALPIWERWNRLGEAKVLIFLALVVLSLLQTLSIMLILRKLKNQIGERVEGDGDEMTEPPR